MKQLLISILLLASVAGFAQNSAAILDKIKQENAKTTSITSDFKQAMHLTFMDEDVLSNGKFFYRKPDRMLMKYAEPEEDMMLIVGDMISMHIMDQYTKVSAKSEPSVELTHIVFSSCLEGNPQRIEGAEVTAVEQTNYYEVTILLKDDKAKNIQAVKAHYDKKDMALSMLKTEFPDGGYTTYELIGKKLNQPIADSIFADPGK